MCTPGHKGLFKIIYIYVYRMFVDKKNFESCFSVLGLTRRVYRLALPLVLPEMLFSSSKYFLIMHTLLYFSGLKDDVIMVAHTHR